MIRRPPRSTLDRSSAASDVYKRQELHRLARERAVEEGVARVEGHQERRESPERGPLRLSLIHISEPTRPY